MATVQVPYGPRSASLDRGQMQHGISSGRSRADGDRTSNHSNATVIKTGAENRPPALNLGLPKGLGGMLKTGTETGDIGIFAFKPPRGRPNPSNSPRRMVSSASSGYLPRNHRGGDIDDRRRLPSYSRDASSEVISMYETASQKSPRRRFDDPNYRAYSITQPHHTLSPHRSYSSLRSQPDGMAQRPRSPFAYPARLRRPGFRPSSPALTDGGLVDYARRAEIERGQPGPRSASPSSLYAQRRRPPPLRANANRSNPSLLSHSSPSSPPRRSPSPFMQQDCGTPRNDWHRRNGGQGYPGSMNSSPARSTFSLASTMNLYQNVPGHTQSTTTTPGKAQPPPSPMYYDYTEDFDDEYSATEQVQVEPPPQFRIDKTIPEDRPMSSQWQNMGNGHVESFTPPRTFVAGPRSSSLPPSMRNGNIQSSHSDRLERAVSAIVPSPRPHDGLSPKTVVAALTNGDVNEVQFDKKIIRLSGLGFGARQLSSHVEEAFGLESSPSFELMVRDEEILHPNGQITSLNSQLVVMNTETETVDRRMSRSESRNSAYSLNTNLQKFPPPPMQINDTMKAGTGFIDLKSAPQFEGQEPLFTQFTRRSSSQSRPIGHDGTTEVSRNNVSMLDRGNSKKRSSMVAEIDAPEITELFSTLEKPNQAGHLADTQNLFEISRQTPLTSSSLSGFSTSVESSTKKHQTPSLLSSSQNVGDQHTSKPLPDPTKLAHRPSKKRKVEPANLPIYGEKEVPNFSHRFPRRQTDSPMLAPKPISPARQLKLKNSVPQLMKSLPSVPPESVSRGVSPLMEMAADEARVPVRPPQIVADYRSTMTPPPKASPSPLGETNKVIAELDSTAIDTIAPVPNEENALPDLQLPKLRLKMRSSGIPPPSPLTSRPWNLDESYPWSSQVSVGLPAAAQQELPEPQPVKQPRFKLKITRASQSTLGTVRVHRDSGESRSGLNFRTPKDLFTPSNDMGNVFRKVSNHLHLRKASANSHSMGITKGKDGEVTMNHKSGGHRLDLEPLTKGPLSSTETEISPPVTGSLTAAVDHGSPAEVRSFFSDNSSHVDDDRGSLRKKLSRFKARITIPYKTQTGAHSHDDITWRGRTEGCWPAPKAARSNPDLRVIRASTDPHPNMPGHVVRFTDKLKSHRIREKLSGWLKGARSAFSALKKPNRAPTETVGDGGELAENV